MVGFAVIIISVVVLASSISKLAKTSQVSSTKPLLLGLGLYGLVTSLSYAVEPIRIVLTRSSSDIGKVFFAYSAYLLVSVGVVVGIYFIVRHYIRRRLLGYPSAPSIVIKGVPELLGIGDWHGGLSLGIAFLLGLLAADELPSLLGLLLAGGRYGPPWADLLQWTIATIVLGCSILGVLRLARKLPLPIGALLAGIVYVGYVFAAAIVTGVEDIDHVWLAVKVLSPGLLVLPIHLTLKIIRPAWLAIIVGWVCYALLSLSVHAVLSLARGHEFSLLTNILYGAISACITGLLFTAIMITAHSRLRGKREDTELDGELRRKAENCDELTW